MPTAKQFRDYMLGEIAAWRKEGGKLENDIAAHLRLFVEDSYTEFRDANKQKASPTESAFMEQMENMGVKFIDA